MGSGIKASNLMRQGNGVVDALKFVVLLVRMRTRHFFTFQPAHLTTLTLIICLLSTPFDYRIKTNSFKTVKRLDPFDQNARDRGLELLAHLHLYEPVKMTAWLHKLAVSVVLCSHLPADLR